MRREAQPSWWPPAWTMATHSRRDAHRPCPPGSGCSPGMSVLPTSSSTTTSLCKYTQMRFESYLPVWYFPETPLPHVHTFVRYINILQRIQPWALLAPLLTSLIHCHCSSRVSFHRETWRQLKCKKRKNVSLQTTLLSPPLTARMLPDTDQLTCQTTS